MLGNKVSPASLCSNELSHPSESMLGEESQQSQTSLFSGEANSMELFSQPASTQSQGHSAFQEESRAVPPVRSATLGSTQVYLPGSQGSCGQKYYMKYLSSTPLSVGKLEGKTPLVSEGRVGGTGCSRVAFEAWKSKQQERLENKQIIDGVIQTTKDIAKELSQTLENLRVEVKEAISPPKQKEEQSGLSDPQLRALLVQLLQGQANIRQGQADIRQELAQLQRQGVQHGEQLQSLETQLSAMGDGLQATLPSALQEHRGAAEALGQRLGDCVARIEALAKRMESLSKTAVAESDTGRERRSMESETGSVSSSGLRPPDQAVPYPSKPCEPTISGSLYEDNSAGKRPHVGQKRPRVMAAVMDNSSVHVYPALTDLPEAPRTARVDQPPTSQASDSTVYDIDLTQESPSLCSQIISQHLEQCSGGGRLSRSLGRRAAFNTQWDVGAGKAGWPEQPPTPSNRLPSKRKKTEPARGKGGRRGRAAYKGVARTPVPKRRSLRLHGFPSCTPPDGGTSRAGGSTASGQLRRVKPRTGGRRSVKESPVNALSDSFYSQSQAAHSAVVPGGGTGLEWSQEGHTQPTNICSTTASGRVQRSSEAARRRLTISHRMMAGMLESDTVLQEISASLRGQQGPPNPTHTARTKT